MVSTIVLNDIDTSSLVPGMGMEQTYGKGGFRGSRANKICLIAEKSTAGTGTADTASTAAFNTSSESDSFFGASSFGAAVARAFFNSVYAGKCQLWGVPLTETGTAAEGVLTFTGTATARGTGVYALGNAVFSASHAKDTTASGLGDDFYDAYTALAPSEKEALDLSVGNGTVTITAQNKGVSAGAGDGVSGYGLEVVSFDVAGCTASFDADTLGGSTPGTGSPSLTTALSNIEGDDFDLIVTTLTDTSSISDVKDHIITQSDGEHNNGCEFVWASKKSVANSVSDIDAVDSNDAERGRTAVYRNTTTWEPMLAMGLAMAIASENDNAVVIDNKRIDTARACKSQYKYTRAEMDTILAGGGSPLIAEDNTNVVVKRCVANRTDLYPGMDHVVTRVSDELRERLLSKFGEFQGLKLKASGQEVHSKGCCTPETFKNAAYEVCKDMEEEDKLEGVDALKEQFSAVHAGGGQVIVGVPYKIVDSVHQVFGQQRQVLVYNHS